MGTLLVQLPDGSAHFHRIESEATVLGRSGDADIHVNARGVSRQHAEIKQFNRRFIIEDMGSKNGIYVNDERVKRVLLEHNDCIVLGEAKLYFYNPGGEEGGPSGPGALAPESRDPRQNPIRWVQTQSEVVMESMSSSSQIEPRIRSVVAGPTPPEVKSPVKEKSVEKRARWLELRCQLLEEVLGVRSVSQLYERVGDQIFAEFHLERLMILEESNEQISMEYLRATHGAAESSKPGLDHEVMYSKSAIRRVRDAMKPLLIRLSDDPQVKTEKVSGSMLSVLAPVLKQGRWFGVLQADFKAGSSPEMKDLEKLAEVADVISRALTSCAFQQQEDAESTNLSFLGAEAPPDKVETLLVNPNSLPSPEALKHYKESHGFVVCFRLLPRPTSPNGTPQQVLQARDEALCAAANIYQEYHIEWSLWGQDILNVVFVANENQQAIASQVAEASINTLLTLVHWSTRQHEKQLPAFGASVAVAFSPLIIAPAELAEDRTLSVGGEAVSRAHLLSQHLADGQLVVDAPTADLLEQSSLSGDIAPWSVTANPAAVVEQANAMELFWKGRSQFSAM
jgi:pSer/pThr/pTyr-binding forkhead associated (FHA) protein